ncbi:unnamed protein product, partial [Meganyctiphanes norvegica]
MGSTQNRELWRYQSAVFTSLFIGYACYTYNRKSVSYTLPALFTQELLTKNGAGAIISFQNTAYGISKFMGGIMSDRVSARLLFSSGLLLSGVACVLFSMTTNPVLWSAMWILNGFAQGAGWPACAKLLKKWYSPTKFGTMWSILSGSSNLSGSLSPFIAAYLILNHGWETSLIFAGSVSIIMSIGVLYILVDDPTSLSLPDPTFNMQTVEEKSTKTKSKEEYENKSAMRTSELLSSPFLWLVSFGAFVIFWAKTALQDWGQLYLIDQLDRTQIQASSFISSIELGGFFGGIIAGIITDRMKNKEHRSGNPRLQVATIFLFGCVMSFHFLCFSVSKDTPQISVHMLFSLFGEVLFSPENLHVQCRSCCITSHVTGGIYEGASLCIDSYEVRNGWSISKCKTQQTWQGKLMVLPKNEIVNQDTFIYIL